jgi:hypothetical protein
MKGFWMEVVVAYIQVIGRVSKQVTDGSKTVVMVYVIDILYVSLGSCTVQLHDSLGSTSACAC